MGYEVRIYRDPNGRSPYREWLEGIKDSLIQNRIITRISRIEAGNLGDHKSVGDGVLELR